MPIWGQFAFGAIYALATPILAILTGVIHEGLGVIITILALLGGIYIITRWRWRGFLSGVLVAISAILIVAWALTLPKLARGIPYTSPPPDSPTTHLPHSIPAASRKFSMKWTVPFFHFCFFASAATFINCARISLTCFGLSRCR